MKSEKNKALRNEMLNERNKHIMYECVIVQ